ncbi:hypothetical protein VTH06DRAFT_1285 [Thermothelomyces fergusii]
MTADTPSPDSPAMRFDLLKGALRDGVAARVGRLAVAGRLPMETPNFIGTTSRGVVPHLTPDNTETETEPSAGPLLPLAVDLSHPAHATALEPLAPGCACYACRAHHRAYVHHLLAAREMLGWTLLQLHNHAVVAAFFAGVRAALARPDDDDDAFAAAARRFARAYEPDFPRGAAERPRARGYQYKSSGRGEGRRNKPAWGKLEEKKPDPAAGASSSSSSS